MTPPAWTTADLRRELRRFERELRAAGLKENSIRTYVDRSQTFVRWLEGEYTPRGGATRVARTERREPRRLT